MNLNIEQIYIQLSKTVKFICQIPVNPAESYFCQRRRESWKSMFNFIFTSLRKLFSYAGFYTIILQPAKETACYIFRTFFLILFSLIKCCMLCFLRIIYIINFETTGYSTTIIGNVKL